MIHSFKAHDLRSKLKFDIELEQGKRVYCFLGENGAGKTQLLENMGRALMLSHKKFRVDWLNGGYRCLGDGVNTNRYLLSSDVYLNGSNMDFEPISGNVDYIDYNDVSQFIVKTNFCYNFPLCFISAENRGYAKNVNTNPELLANVQTQFLRAVGTSLTEMKCFGTYEASNKNIADWIATRTIMNPDTLSFDYRRVLAEVDLLFNILSPLMPRELSLFDSEGKLLVRYEPVKLYVANTEIDKLPTGVISLMRIMQEIISCYGAWNGVLDEGEKLDDILQTEGIVFIDEIEAHMHPKWQAAIIPLLKKSFPKTTFYIATHSPAIVATTSQGEAYELERDGENVTAQSLGNPGDWYLEDIFSTGFDVRLPQKQDGQETIEDRILVFSKLSQEFMREEGTENKSRLKHKITEMYHKLSEQFKTMPDEAKSDPRRDALEEIWKYAQ